ncbi:MAG TPA: DUF1080 domain-containing protein [Chitinophagaceae bacterium]|nr:DUF1080 domain-containing protein [Chitinophagaceae bacterium]
MRKAFPAFILFCTLHADAQKTKPLFNGFNLKGWYSFLPSKGINNDPEKIFAVEDGLMHISGKEFGYIATKKIFTNFHLSLEFKWGIKKYAPRDTAKRDNGILFYFSNNDSDKVWPKSIECQIQEGDTGDFWLIDSTTITVNGVRSIPKDFSRVIKMKDNEHANGEWNRVEIIAKDEKIIYIVNGTVVNEGNDPSIREGKIALQSEGAEIYYRNIEIAEL